MEDSVKKWYFDPKAVKIEPRPAIHDPLSNESFFFLPDLYRNLLSNIKKNKRIFRRRRRI